MMSLRRVALVSCVRVDARARVGHVAADGALLQRPLLGKQRRCLASQRLARRTMNSSSNALFSLTL